MQKVPHQGHDREGRILPLPAEYIANLDSDIKADEALYEERLAACKECDLLLEGMCRICGCYVELRAVVAKNICPRKKW